LGYQVQDGNGINDGPERRRVFMPEALGRLQAQRLFSCNN
jgi:hypothetical protein